MRQDTLTIDLVLRDEEHATLCLAGEIDMSTAPDLRAAALAALHHHGPNLNLDLTQVDFMDSTGLEALMSTRRRANLGGGRLRLIDPGHTVLRVLEVSGVASLFPMDQPPDLAAWAER